MFLFPVVLAFVILLVLMMLRNHWQPENSLHNAGLLLSVCLSVLAAASCVYLGVHWMIGVILLVAAGFIPLFVMAQIQERQADRELQRDLDELLGRNKCPPRKPVESKDSHA